MRYWHDGSKILGKRLIRAFDAGLLSRRHVTPSGQSVWFAHCTHPGCSGEYCFTQTTKAGAATSRCPIHSKKFFVSGNGTNSATLAALGDRVIWKSTSGRKSLVAHVACGASDCGKSVAFRRNKKVYLCVRHSSWRRRHRPYEALYNSWVRGHVKRAQHRRFPLEIQISFEQFTSICERDQHCFYCGDRLARGPYNYKPKKGAHYSRAVYLDRVDPFGHYTCGNVVSACGQCNLSKNMFVSKEEMQVIALLRRGRLREAVNLIKRIGGRFEEWGEASRALTVFGIFGHKTPELALNKVSAYFESEEAAPRAAIKGAPDT